MSRTPARRRSGEMTPPVDKINPTETHSITFEWPLHDLKQHFDLSTSDTKSKVIKSVPFGQGRWTVLFYAQSGLQQFCSLYLNAEPTLEEKNQNKSPWEAFLRSKGGAGYDEGWTRQGLFRFTFKILTLNTGSVLATKEACNHAFSHKTSNWGWAQFASRNAVFYDSNEVQQSNGFLISVTITASAEPPKPLSLGVPVPPTLIEAMGSLLDDPDHSDVVFVIRRKRRHPKTGAIVTSERRIYAIKKILASRCEYFRDMFESGFLEADATTSSDDEADDTTALASASSRGIGQDQLGLLGAAYSSSGDDDDDDLGLEDSDEEMDIDEVYELGRSDVHDQRNGSDDALVRNLPLAISQPELASMTGGSEQSAPRRMRETSSDVPQHRLPTTQPLPSANQSTPVSTYTQSSQRNTPPQSRSRQGDEHDAGTDSGEESARIQGMSAFQTPQRSPRELRHGSAGLVSPSIASQSRMGQMSQAKAALQQQRNGKALPQSRKSEESGSGGASPAKKRRKVVVRDAAYATYKALLYYLYTDTVAFVPLHSHFYSQVAANTDQADAIKEMKDSFDSTLGEDPSTASASYANSEAGAPAAETLYSTSSSFIKDRRRAHMLRQQVVDDYCSAHANVPAPCSAKSMYRLADKLQIPELKKRAQEELAKNLTVDNIVWEVFSGFNSQFPAIRKMETDFLLKHWAEVKGTEVMKSIFSRPSAHPGLADVWPDLLSQLEFRGSGVEAKEDGLQRS